ncbi:HNH endonuclease [Nocardioides sp. zg-536]|uniref:HNH endonuclease n=1 Tax=Nocardioides faecalis TaxID=2803858 RepID=A0A938Y558_9ACTN|nr:HNH endonuclease signature motif containing protein [Nocardioides faecalis]MBM9459412.1 HNH endonuclease [Nocardioides faecalis]QVI59480.1 HNH endonuclease [Nocardioides faecalis]
MDLRSSTAVAEHDGRPVAELLNVLSAGVRRRAALMIDEWAAIVAWADQNVVDAPEHAATVRDSFVDTGVPIAGTGAPLVSEFNLMELIAVLGRSPDGGRIYVGRIVECAWRLPLLYGQVMAGKVATWRAERVADLTHGLNAEAAAFVDRQVASRVGRVGWAALDRIVATAILRHDPEAAEARRKDASDHRHFEIGEANENGLSVIGGLLDAAGAADLDDAVGRRATLLGRLGSEDSLDVRRSIAVGELARNDLELDLLTTDEETGEVTVRSAGRKAEISVHITDTMLNEVAGEVNAVGRWHDGRRPVLKEQIREWLRTATSITVQPVIDLADCDPVNRYEIPARHRKQVELRDTTCRFPGCSRRAERCDLDHRIPHADGGSTCPCNEFPCCRRHHRAKTHSGWRYFVLMPGHLLWRSPHGWFFHVGPNGTQALDPPGHWPDALADPSLVPAA